MAANPAQWSREEAKRWYDEQGWLVGCNFIPSSAVNELEMWQAATFDAATLDRELGWAEGIGFNCARVFLHDLLWDQAGFLERVDQYLDIAWRHHIKTMFVLFDGVWDPRPVSGPQRPPRPGVHNSGWVQSPGAAILSDPARYGELEAYVTGVIGHLASDERVLAWDLFNEPDHPNPAYAGAEMADKAEKAFRLLREVYGWARKVRPTQPLTSGVWRTEWVNSGATSELDEYQLSESDVVSFHAYAGLETIQKRLDELGAYGRPILLTEYLARGLGNTFESVLPTAKELRLGVFNWGLVSGKTQTIYPWDSWVRAYAEEPAVWFHDILRADGTPYDDQEVAFLRQITGG